MIDTTTAPETFDMAALLEQYPVPRTPAQHSIVPGEVIAKSRGGYFVNIGQKSESLVQDADEELEVGSTYQFFVVSSELSDEGAVVLSYRLAGTWNRLAVLAQTGETTTARVKSISRSKKTGKVAGLNVVSEGVIGFLPGSEIDYMGDFEELVGSTIPVKIKTVEPEVGNSGNLIVSRRAAVAELKTEALSKIDEGEIHLGVVRKVIRAGAIVEIGDHVVGLVHRSELSEDRGAKPEGVVVVGQELLVRFLGVDIDKGRISLSSRQAARATFLDDLGEGDIVSGAIARFEPYGAFVNIGGYVDGLLHKVDQIDGEILEVGQVVRVSVKRIDRERVRLSLSRKDVAAE